MHRCIVALQLVFLMMLNIAAAPVAVPRGADVGDEATIAAASSHGQLRGDETPAKPVADREQEAEETADDAEDGILFDLATTPPSHRLFLEHAKQPEHSDVHLRPPDRPPRSL